MKKTPVFIVVVISLTLFLSPLCAQTWQWARQCGDSAGGYSDGSAMCIDPSGNIIVAGEHLGPLTAGVYTVSGSRDYYVKYSPAGNVLWTIAE